MKNNKLKLVLIVIASVIVLLIIFLCCVQIYDNKINLTAKNPLYKIDILDEKILLLFTRNDKQIDMYLEFMDERISEIKSSQDANEINTMVNIFNSYYNEAQARVDRLDAGNQAIYRKKIINSMFSLLALLSQSGQDVPDSLINNVNLSIGSLPDEEKENIIKENKANLNIISTRSKKITDKIMSGLPAQTGGSAGSDTTGNDDQTDQDTTEPVAPYQPNLRNITTAEVYALYQDEVKDINNIESINIIENKRILSVFAIINKKDPAYQEVTEDDLVIIFKQSGGKYVKIGTYPADTLDSANILKTKDEIASLKLTSEELHWLVFNNSVDTIINFY